MEKELINILYGTASLLNEKYISLDLQVNHLEKLTFIEISDFYLTSHMMSYLKNRYLDNIESRGIYFSSRCILEGIALYKLYEAKKILPEMVDLFKRNYFLIEYKYYSRDVQLFHSITNFQTMEQNYENTISIYKNILKEKKPKEISSIINSKLPFLLGLYNSYEDIIQAALGDDGLLVYKNLSFVIHPHDSNFLPNNMFSSFIQYIDQLVINYLKFKPVAPYEYTIKHDLFHYAFQPKLLGILTPTAEYMEDLIDQLRRIDKIVVEFDRAFTPQNFMSDILRTYTHLFFDISIDLLIGLPEHVKMKFKMIIEMFSVYHYFNIKQFELHQNAEEDVKMDLYSNHAIIMSKKNSNEEYREELNQTYDKFFSWSKKNISLDVFSKKYLTTFGFLIDKNGKVPNITSTVNTFLDDLLTNSTNPQELKNASIYQLYYAESQMLSHANGYMINANTGAWADDINAINLMENMLFYMLNSLLLIFKVHRINENGEYSKLIYVLEHNLKKIRNGCANKQKLYKVPRISKN